MPREQRRAALIVAKLNEAIRTRIVVWLALAEQLRTGNDGRVRLVGAGPAPCLEVHGVKAIHVTLQGKPVLHLDATLRPELARTVLPRLSVREIDAAAPFMAVTLIAGSFGKSTLCPDAATSASEQQRRANRLGECVDYVRWQARRLSPGRVLVVTYLDVEAAFAGIPGVEVAHFNAVAGLDRFRDVAGLIVIGRPLPRDRDLVPLVAAYFGEAISGGYVTTSAGVRMRDGRSRTVRDAAREQSRREPADSYLRRRADPGGRPRAGDQPNRHRSAGGAPACGRRPAAGARSRALVGGGRAGRSSAHAVGRRGGGQSCRCGTSPSGPVYQREAGAEAVRASRI
jgi:hypothetical protein